MNVKQQWSRDRDSTDRMKPTFVTRTGEKLRVRLLQPADAPKLLDLFHRLSPETRRRRFHGNVDHLSVDVLTAASVELSDVDNRTTQGAVVMAKRGSNGDEEFVGVVRLARPLNDAASPIAEAAIVVRDDFQGQGVGTELLRRMVLLAQRMQVRTIRAVFAAYNEGAINLFRNLGLPYTIDIDHGETEMRIAVPPQGA